MSIGPAEIMLVLVVALIVLGPERLPKAARQIGSALSELKKASSSLQQQVNDAIQIDDGTQTPKQEPAPVSHPDTDGFRLIDGSAGKNQSANIQAPGTRPESANEDPASQAREPGHAQSGESGHRSEPTTAE